MAKRKIVTGKIQGNDYAYVGERILAFREDWSNGKIETDHTNILDNEGNIINVEFKAWVWKDKTQLLELMKAGVTNKETLRSSADADGDSSGLPKGSDKKEFEKLQTVAVGRALSNVGYSGNGIIASFEEMEIWNEYQQNKHEFNEFKSEKASKLEEERARKREEVLDNIANAKTIEELKEVYVKSGFTNDDDVAKAKDDKKKELLETEKEAKE